MLSVRDQLVILLLLVAFSLPAVYVFKNVVNILHEVERVVQQTGRR